MAEIKPNYDTKRKKLADIIPLAQPFTVYIEQTKYCNFKCFYCIHSTRDEAGGEFQKLGHRMMHMDEAYFDKIVHDLQEFPKGGVKRIVFSGLGEPLTNPLLPTFVKKIVDADIAGRVEVITNGLLLTPEKSDALVAAGITNINISVQGLDAVGYENTCGVRIDFEQYLENLRYLFAHKKNTAIYIKAIDATVPTEEEQKTFLELFSPMADRIYIEHLVVMQQQMEDLKGVVDGSKNFYGEELDLERQVCAQSFYFLPLGCEGHTFPCPVPGLGKGLSMGSAKEQSLVEIWNGPKRRAFLRMLLQKRKDEVPECRGCTCFNAINNPAEDLDADAERLLPLFS